MARHALIKISAWRVVEVRVHETQMQVGMSVGARKGCVIESSMVLSVEADKCQGQALETLRTIARITTNAEVVWY